MRIPGQPLLALLVAGVMGGCSTTSTSDARPPAVTVHARSTISASRLRKVERLMDALSGSEAHFQRMVQLDREPTDFSTVHSLFLHLDELRSKLRQRRAVFIGDSSAFEYFRWDRQQHQLAPTQETPALPVHFRVDEGGLIIEFGVMPLICEFEVPARGRKIVYHGHLYD